MINPTGTGSNHAPAREMDLPELNLSKRDFSVNFQLGFTYIFVINRSIVVTSDVSIRNCSPLGLVFIDNEMMASIRLRYFRLVRVMLRFGIFL